MLSDYPEIMSIAEAMKALGISRNTLYGYIRDDMIHAFKLGAKMWRIKKEDLIKYMNNN